MKLARELFILIVGFLVVLGVIAMLIKDKIDEKVEKITRPIIEQTERERDSLHFERLVLKERAKKN